ncbi:tRNA glutamyl-Q(34) synthetase GluQRS [Shewanella surugensis]|uniref:Glutamyl-Q tRNA(Asp) synthetase n=1 Tax=Shewanella surugensis TaxID=212020 RepID=A0ABT0L5P5_9GAMM|nr:tRNA glutamyl-Q(34) synthetase GluQRS [Shewanella surugensis]MCL1122990.1 tRNA glutamyl-Q(34) synthetase GluQRS [Shewanella surugensis]
MTNPTHSTYRGRFAPSPSGPLHFGSLIAALGSYLRARSKRGQWLVRMEDIDPPREQVGAADTILHTLEAFGFEWDEKVLYQSQRVISYQAVIHQLLTHNQAYYCQCSRKQIKAMGGFYDGRCGQRLQTHQQGAIRIRNPGPTIQFNDMIKGMIPIDPHFAAEDFIIKRSDGLYAYQLAVVIDDAFQQITEVVRGSDLLLPTGRQINLFQLLGKTPPHWLHLPLACEEKGKKLSKQNHATAIDIHQPQISINQALCFLGQETVTVETDTRLMLAQAIAQFKLDNIPTQTEILLD